ncbi:MAG TPA: hypothetical protein VHV49_19085 [Pseudonocardiaceae bacterium]|nr:hypothetical protein [Pseudonocardiaceae bacterium]
MSLSEREQRQLAAADRALSGDPVLRALCELFPGPAARGEFRAVRWTAHRLLLVMVWSVVIMAVGLATTIVAAALADPPVVVGPAVMVTAAVAFVVSAIRRGVRMPHLRRVAALPA